MRDRMYVLKSIPCYRGLIKHIVQHHTLSSLPLSALSLPLSPSLAQLFYIKSVVVHCVPRSPPRWQADIGTEEEG